MDIISDYVFKEQVFNQIKHIVNQKKRAVHGMTLLLKAIFT